MKSYKEYAKELFDNITSGINEIIDKYDTLISERKNYYEEEEKSLSPKYQGYKNSAAAKADSDLKNAQYSLASKGLASSGESLTAQLSNSAALQNSLAALDASYEGELSKLKAQKNDEVNALTSEKLSKAADLKNDAYKTLLDFEESERKLALDEEKERNEQKNEEAELKIKEEYLELEKQKENKGESDGTNEDGEVTISLSRSPSELIEYLELKYTSFDWENGGAPDTSKVKTQIRKLLANPHLSLQYKYELDIYAKLLGYL